MRSRGLQTLKKVDKSPNEFTMKTVNEYLNETTRPTDREIKFHYIQTTERVKTENLMENQHDQ